MTLEQQYLQTNEDFKKLLDDFYNDKINLNDYEEELQKLISLYQERNRAREAHRDEIMEGMTSAARRENKRSS